MRFIFQHNGARGTHRNLPTKTRIYQDFTERGFLGFAVRIRPGLNEIEPEKLQLLQKYSKPFQGAMFWEGGGPPEVVGEGPMLRVLGERSPDGKVRLESKFKREVIFDAPEVVFPAPYFDREKNEWVRPQVELNDRQFIRLMGWEAYLRFVRPEDVPDELRELEGCEGDPKFKALVREGTISFVRAEP